MTFTLELTDEEAGRVRAAQQNGIDVSALMRGLLSGLPQNNTIEPLPQNGRTVMEKTGGGGMVALLEQWEREDATNDEAELNRRDDELRDFKKNINAERERAEARKLY